MSWCGWDEQRQSFIISSYHSLTCNNRLPKRRTRVIATVSFMITIMMTITTRQILARGVHGGGGGIGVAFQQIQQRRRLSLAVTQLVRHRYGSVETVGARGCLDARKRFKSLRYLSSSSSSFMDDHFLLQQALHKAEQADQQEILSKSWTASLKSLPFACTACGKCCRTKGSVYLSPAEIQNTANFFNVTEEEFIQTYASHILPATLSSSAASAAATPVPQPQELSNATTSGAEQRTSAAPLSLHDCWMVLKNHPDHEACIFLDNASNACTIYPVRPSQCSTYPFWPAILQSQATWNDEVRRPPPIDGEHDNVAESNQQTNGDDSRSSSKPKLSSERIIPNRPPPNEELPEWTPELGGCEGMRWISNTGDQESIGNDNKNEDSVSTEEAYRLLNIYQREERDMPRNPPIPIEKIFFDSNGRQ